MIKLLRTHPRHLAGNRVSPSGSPRLSIRRPNEASGFDKTLKKALETVTGSLPSGRKATPLLHDLLRPLLSLQKIQHYERVFPAPPPPKTAAIGEASSVSTRVKGTGNLDRFIEEASKTFNVEKSLIRAVIKAESNFNPQAKSKSGAVGLMQLLPSTARELGVRDLYDPRDNILAGTRYLAMLLDRYEGNLELALAAYNWGPGNLGRTPERLPPETEKYVQRVLKYMGSLTA